MSQALGERRHEACRYGVFSSHSVRLIASGEQPFAMPLCAWSLGAAPPAVGRAWGGAIEYDRDCAVCPVYAPLGVG